MGNRLLALLSATLYARLSGRKLIIDWRDTVYSNDREDSFPFFFNCRTAGSWNTIPVNASIFPTLWQDHLAGTVSDIVLANDPKRAFDFRSLLRYSADPARLDYDQQLVVMCPYRDQVTRLRRQMRGPNAALARLSRLALLRWMWDQEFSWSDAVTHRVTEAKEQLWGSKMIGVHVRHTDIKVPLKKYLTTVDRLVSKVPDATIFLATDGAGVDEVFRTRYKRVASVPKDTSVRGNNGRLHAAATDRVRHGIEAVVDMGLLSLCDYLVYSSRSTFAVVSHLWSNSPQERIIDIDRHNLLLWSKRMIQDWVVS